MRKTTIIILVALLAVSVCSFVFANEKAPFYHHNGYGYNDSLSLTDEQKTQLEKLQKQRFEQRKKMLSDKVAWGWISQEQADQEISRMERILASGDLEQMDVHHSNHGWSEHGGGNW